MNKKCVYRVDNNKKVNFANSWPILQIIKRNVTMLGPSNLYFICDICILLHDVECWLNFVVCISDRLFLTDK